jgi:hypothetical protein
MMVLSTRAGLVRGGCRIAHPYVRASQSSARPLLLHDDAAARVPLNNACMQRLCCITRCAQ